MIDSVAEMQVSRKSNWGKIRFYHFIIQKMFIERQFSQGPAPKEVEDLWLFPARLAPGYSYIAGQIFILRLSEFFFSPSLSGWHWRLKTDPVLN